MESKTDVFPEAAEAHLPLRPNVEKENCKSIDTENHNYTQQSPPEVGHIPLTHLNGSVKLTISEMVQTEENANKPEQQPPPPVVVSSENEEPHNLWKFPRSSGKFTQVRKY